MASGSFLLKEKEKLEAQAGGSGQTTRGLKATRQSGQLAPSWKKQKIVQHIAEKLHQN